MIRLPSALISAKNRMNQDDCYLILLEIIFGATTLRIVRNTEDISWNSETWTAFPFTIGNIDEVGNSENPNVTIAVSNINRTAQAYINAVRGGINANVNIRVVNSEHLSETTPLLEIPMTVLDTTSDEQNVTFTLGAEDFFRRRFPRNRITLDRFPTAGGRGVIE